MKRNGILFVISAPSGAGKTSLCRQIVDIFPDMRHSISFTTRPRRNGETDGVDYHFVTPEVFDTMVAEGAFAEWARVHGNCYGTALATLQEAREQGQDLLLDIDCQGAAQLKRNCPDDVFIFILPPSFEELERRLRGRNTDTAEVIARRLDNARREIRELVWYDYLIVNEDLPRAVEEFKSIILAEGCRASRIRSEAGRLFDIDMQDNSTI
ncbi:guanylate kinase [Syntrophotalea carbinolica DSM 2380]|uniref:Guanylate kinase n=1 Tax=Syntrophotalea carbinolica (strain DSM 2380 / NBRC 103641 / GraBd1) TaxID=338963 RepID=KGUA_SYNC1|nr:guanylate kinase [Syntrophotalea carbinolica]Q3A523.1 RecName: Full=Guanylate kinase; AltName: Full=GMP kinase [Syntrophotalea carbinolica DSM 2380]ABA88534.1 guanylate kinase [Syntrophotalea carbinolica DSM 2380]